MLRHIYRFRMMSTPKKKTPKESVSSDKGVCIEKKPNFFFMNFAEDTVFGGREGSLLLPHIEFSALNLLCISQVRMCKFLSDAAPSTVRRRLPSRSVWSRSTAPRRLWLRAILSTPTARPIILTGLILYSISTSAQVTIY